MQHTAGHGWAGLQPEIAACYRRLGRHATEAKAAYCMALDYFTFQSTLLFPADLRPPFFAERAVAFRSLGAVSAMPHSEASQFIVELQASMEESVRKATASD